jgi:hypothetical protein
LTAPIFAGRLPSGRKLTPEEAKTVMPTGSDLDRLLPNFGQPIRVDRAPSTSTEADLDCVVFGSAKSARILPRP